MMDYRIIDGAENMKMEDIQRLLKMTYWADKRSPETVEKSVKMLPVTESILMQKKSLWDLQG